MAATSKSNERSGMLTRHPRSLIAQLLLFASLALYGCVRSNPSAGPPGSSTTVTIPPTIETATAAAPATKVPTMTASLTPAPTATAPAISQLEPGSYVVFSKPIRLDAQNFPVSGLFAVSVTNQQIFPLSIEAGPAARLSPVR